MPRAIPGLALAALALALGACDRPAEVYQRVIPLFGTTGQVEIVARDPQLAGQALDRIEALYLELDRDWRSFGAGELGRVNAALESGQRVELSPRLERLIRRGLELRSLSDGLLEPRVGTLVSLWGFEDMARHTPQEPPDEATITRLRRQTLQAAELHLEHHSIRSDAPVRLDLNALAEGAALQAGAMLLHDLGVSDALIDTGGDLLALGRRGTRAWRVGIRNPAAPGVLGTVELEPGEAVASSGSYEHRFGASGEHHHILDPRTGHPAQDSLGATVIARDAELADATATVLIVAGPARFEEMVRRMGVQHALLVTTDGRVLATEAMRGRLGWAEHGRGDATQARQAP